MAEVHRLSTLLFTAILFFVVIMADNQDAQDLKISPYVSGNSTVIEGTRNLCQTIVFRQMDLIEEKKETIVTLTSRIDSCETNLAQQRNKGAQCLDKSKDRIAFSAYLKSDIHDAFTLDTIIFDGVVLNNGNGYNSSIGTFTCTIPGTYVFHHKLAVKKSSYMSTTISKDDKTVSWNEAAGDETTDGTGSSTAILNLQHGDVVQVKKVTSSSGAKVKAKYTTFGGHKIY